jgi:hypothetical protein
VKTQLQLIIIIIIIITASEIAVFFGRGEISSTQATVWRLVVGSQAKHRASSPVKSFLKKSGLLSAVAIKSRQAAILRPLCPGVKQCGTKRKQTIRFRKSPITIFLIVLSNVHLFCYHS